MSKKKLLLGVNGTIGSHNVPMFIHYLNREYDINVILTHTAQRFLTIDSLRPIVENVYTDPFDMSILKVPHVNLVKETDIFLILPTSANFLSKLANGNANDLLSLCALNYDKPIFIAPNMNTTMWNQPSVQNNVKTIQNYGHKFVNVTSHGFEASSGNTVSSEASLPEPNHLMYILNSEIEERVGNVPV